MAVKHYVLRPQYPGSLLHPYEEDASGAPQRVGFKYFFWSPEPLIGSRLYFLRRSAARALREAGMTGFEAEDVPTEMAVDYNPVSELGEPAPCDPEPLAWLRITGAAGTDDFGLWLHRAVVSERALNVLREHGLRLCWVDPYDLDRPPKTMPMDPALRKEYFAEFLKSRAELVAAVEAEGGTVQFAYPPGKKQMD